ncbi:MAG: S-adenosylmethionine decarboxylase [Candidatus Aenigmatarchaeota archaeon]
MKKDYKIQKIIREFTYCFYSYNITDLDKIPDEKNLKLLTKIAKIGNCEPIQDSFSISRYPEQGTSLYIAIKESSISMHTWPEYNYGILKFESCSDKTDFDKIKKFMRRVFKPYKDEIYYQNFIISSL